MARIRTIKPEISYNERLFDLEQETGYPIRFFWSILPCHCCREGRFPWNPRRLKVQMLPYDDVDLSRVLHALWTRGFLEKYRENDTEYGVIPTFLKHQVINNREGESPHPEPNENNTLTRESSDNDAWLTRDARVPQGREGKGREGNSTKKDSMSGKPDEPPPEAQAITYLNEKAGKNFQLVESNLRPVRGRLGEGRTLDEIKSVVDDRVAAWSGNPDMQEYLRPATLFNAEKFNQYFGQIGSGRSNGPLPPNARMA